MPLIMTKFTRCIALLMAFYVAIALQTASAQSVLDPNDPVITYDSTKPPVQPPDGQIGKWVRTVRMNWNTDMYKAYIYKGLAFRLHFPKTYNPTATDGKKYPIMLFFHGHGEYGPITDNEYHLLLGHQGFDQAINDGTFDGYVLSAQSTDFFNITDYDRIMQVVNYMIQNNKVDPFHITVNGLSQGGQACWEMLSTFPTYISAAQPMSWSQSSYTDPTFINKIKYTPNWVFQGTEDTNPYPSTTYSVRDAMVAAGANFRLTVYQGVGHGTWWNAWGDPDFWPFINRAYSSNPWQVGGSKFYWPGTAISAVIGLPAGFSAYEWRKDGVLISGAASNTITANSGGIYSARVQRNGLWSDWSHVPVAINPGRLEAENYSAMSGVSIEGTLDEGSGQDVGWISQGDWMDYTFNPATAGTYTLKFRVASPGSGGKIAVKKADGTVIATVTVPNTGGWQTWQTVSIPITLSTGTQTLRLESAAVNGWNINWIEFSNGATGNQAPNVNAGSNQTITLPANSATLNGTASDPDGSIASYSWTKVTGGAATITSPSSASTTVTGLVQGSYTFRLTVTDNLGASASSDVNITVNAAGNQAPTANAGADQSITEPASSVTLTGSGTDADGTIASYAWTKLSGGAATITSPSSASTSVTGLTQGSYTFRLTVTDNSGATATDDVVVTVNASVPTGSSLHIEAENWSAMSGVLTEACSDAGGTKDVGWIDNGDWMDYAINPTTSGTYTLKLRIASPYSTASLQVKNGATVLATVNLPSTGGWQNWQTVSVTVNLTAGPQTLRLAANSSLGWNINWLELSQGTNQAPTANAGADQSITEPASSVTLTGSGTDADGTIASYAWTKLSGGAATITSPSSASTSVTGLTQGSYTFRLTVTDNSGATATDDVVVTVNASVPTGSSLHIEAENWSAMSGVLTENTADVGGGKDVGWIDLNDWMDYAINPTASGTYTLSLRIASIYNTSQLQVKSGATVLATVNIPNTGGYQAWQTINVPINLTAGAQTLRILSTSAQGFNINWLEIASPGTVTGRIAAAPIREQMETVISTAAIYPNPVRDRFTMTLQNSFAGAMKVQVVNMAGVLQKQFSVNKANNIMRTDLSISDLPKGEYLLLIDMNGKKESRKIIKL
jgi:hypothetical protein